MLAIDTNSLSERIEARVGNEIITSTDLKARMDLMAAERRNPDRRTVLDALIDEVLVKQFLDQNGLSVSDKDIELRIQAMKERSGAKTNEEFQLMAASQGINLDQIRTQLRRESERAQFFGAMKRQSAKTIEENDLRAYFQANQSDFANTFEVSLRECVVPYGADVKKAEEVAESFVKAPKRFSSCVKTVSASPSAQNNGELGTFKRGSLREEVERLVFAAEAGAVVEVPLARGIQLIKIESKKNLGPRSFEDAREDIRRILEDEIVEKEVQKTLSELRSKTFIQIPS